MVVGRSHSNSAKNDPQKARLIKIKADKLAVCATTEVEHGYGIDHTTVVRRPSHMPLTLRFVFGDRKRKQMRRPCTRTMQNNVALVCEYSCEHSYNSRALVSRSTRLRCVLDVENVKIYIYIHVYI